jgi:hypothetical protein
MNGTKPRPGNASRAPTDVSGCAALGAFPTDTSVGFHVHPWLKPFSFHEPHR